MRPFSRVRGWLYATLIPLSLCGYLVPLSTASAQDGTKVPFLSGPLAPPTNRDTAFFVGTKPARDSMERALKSSSVPAYAKRAIRAHLAADSALVRYTPPAPPTPVPASIAIHSNGAQVNVGDSLQLYAEVKDSTGKVLTTPVKWGVGSTTLCDISGVGLLKGKAAGQCTATATASPVTSARTYPVVAANPPPDTTTPPDTSKPKPPQPGPIVSYPVPPGLGLNLATVAELPRDTIDTKYPKVTRVVQVPLVANLQSYLDNAQPGDELRLPQGGVFTGDFLLPKHAGAGAATCSAWIVLRTNVADSLLGPEGVRMTPTRAKALNLARIQNTDNQAAIGTAWGVPNVGCWRIDGVEVAPGPAGFDVNGLIRFGDPNNADSTKQAHHLVVARSFVHGVVIPANVTNNQQQGWLGSIRRCYSLQSRYNAVIDSWAEQCRGGNGDPQTVLMYAGTGPYVIRNNHLSGGAEVVMIGGATGGMVNAHPADIWIVGNFITRELADTLTLVKNLFEIKNAERVYFVGNVTRLNWPNGQAGFGWLIKSVNQSSGACTRCHAQDITIAYNSLTMSGSGMNLAGIQEAPAEPAARYTIYQNYIDTLGFRTTSDNARPYQVLGGYPSSLSDVILAFNTLGPTSVSTNGAALWGAMNVDGYVQRITMQSSVWFCGGYGFKGNGTGQGTITFTTFFQPYLWATQALYGCSGGHPQGTTYYPAYAGALSSGVGATLNGVLDNVVVAR